MAKKKASASGAKSKTASTAKPKKKTAKTKPAATNKPSTTKKKAATAQQALSNARIGETAGKLWQALSEKNGQTLPSLKKSVDAPSDLVLAAVGWLAREDKLAFDAGGRSIKITLR